MVEAQELEPLGTPGEVHDPGLLGMQSQPEVGKDRRHQFAGRFGLALGGGEDDEIVGIPDQHSHLLPFVLPTLIQGVQCDVREQR
jgi:hypothetical protein